MYPIDFSRFSSSSLANEIKYGAFNLPTSDFHNDLFGFLQERLNQITGVSTNIDDVDNFIDGQTGNYAVPTGWINGRGDRTLPVYIRNCIHHPESTIEPNPIRQNNAHIYALKSILPNYAQSGCVSIIAFSSSASLYVTSDEDTEVIYIHNILSTIKYYNNIVTAKLELKN